MLDPVDRRLDESEKVDRFFVDGTERVACLRRTEGLMNANGSLELQDD